VRTLACSFTAFVLQTTIPVRLAFLGSDKSDSEEQSNDLDRFHDCKGWFGVWWERGFSFADLRGSFEVMFLVERKDHLAWCCGLGLEKIKKRGRVDRNIYFIPATDGYFSKMALMFRHNGVFSMV